MHGYCPSRFQRILGKRSDNGLMYFLCLLVKLIVIKVADKLLYKVAPDTVGSTDLPGDFVEIAAESDLPF